MRTPGLWALAALVSCTGAVDKGDGGGEGGDADTDADTDLEECGSYSGIAGIGTTWDYDYDNGISTGSYTVEITAIGGGEVTTSEVQNTSGSDKTNDSTVTQTFTCDEEGLKIAFYRIDKVYTAAGVDYETWEERTYDPPALILPATLAVGQSWEVEAHYTVVSESNEEGQTYANTWEYEVTAQEQVEVPAGTWMSYRVERSGGSTWYAEDVGRVQDDVLALAEYTP